METQKKKLSKGFWGCACTEIFERLAYYLGRSLILIFATTAVVEGGLGLSESVGANLQANLTAFSYLGGLLGGVVVDRYIGARYTTPVGMVITGIGYFSGSLAKDAMGVYIMIFLVSLGLGLFKNGPIIGRVVGDKDQLDTAYAIRYTTVNLGAFIGTFAVGILYKDVFAKDGVLGFAPCFQIAAVVMVLGAIWFVFNYKNMGEVGKKPFKLEKTAEELAADKEKGVDPENKRPLTGMEKKRVAAIFLVCAFSVIFWIFWYLAYLPVYYHWAENCNWVVGGYEIPVTWFDSANSMICIILGPVTAALWAFLAKRPQGDMSLFRKTGLGIGILGLGYVFFAAMEIMRGDGKANVFLLLIFAFFLTLGEMFFSPLGHSFISKYSPSKYLGVMMSVWGFATFLAAKSYGYIYDFCFGGNFAFETACIGIAVVAFACTATLLILDKKLSALVD